MVSKQRLIDSEPIKKFIVDGLNNPDKMKAFGHDAIEILAEIEYAPKVDAVEVVRCRECKHCKEYKNRLDPMYNHLMCVRRDGYVYGVDEDDFCSCGEKER